MTARPPVWFERAVLAELRHEVEQQATILGPATDDEPLGGLDVARGAVVGAQRFDAAVMDRAPQLRVIARAGIGVDGVDVAEATRRGIVVCNVPDGPTVSTAEHTIALLLAVAKRLPQSQSRLRSAERDLYANHSGIELHGATIGLVGYGRIARRVATAARGLGMAVAIFDPYLTEEPARVEVSSSLEHLLSTVDVVSVHIPLTGDTVGAFGPDEFARMRAGAVFLNAARGRLVDHTALLAALESGRLFGAGLDVTDPEPLPPEHPLLHRDDVVVTPHVASATRAAKLRLFRGAFDQVIQVLDGRRPPHLVDPAAWTG